MEKSLKIYRSSAGSGKTFTLVKEYLKLCLPQPDRYRHVAAITFTNAAAAEMKDRILQKLKEIAAGTDEQMGRQLVAEGLQPHDLENAGILLQNILFNYDHFQVSTIDSFFSRIIRAFNRELDLPSGFELFLETQEALDYAVDSFIHRSQIFPEQHKLMLSFLREKINSGASWVLRPNLRKMAEELIKDSELLMQQASMEDVTAFIETLKELRSTYEAAMHDKGSRALTQLKEMGLEISHFKYGDKGPAGHFSKILNENKQYGPGLRFVSALGNEEEWYKKKTPEQRAIEEALGTFLLNAAQDIHDHYTENHGSYIAANEILKHVYAFAVYEQIAQLIQEYRIRNNVVLVSDQSKILARHLLSEDISFIYSKIGAKLEHFLIDEFQDTSSLQWLSLKPLVENSVAQGASCLIVGDAKQAIYRWRGGEVQLIEQQLSQVDFPMHSSQFQLDTNYRSKPEVIRFNNTFFGKVPELFPQAAEIPMLRSIFNAAAQEFPQGAEEGGYVQVDLILPKARKSVFREESKRYLLDTLHRVFSQGYSPADICLLVRTTSEAKDIAQTLAAAGIDFITQDSLYLSHSPAIRLLLAALGWLNDESDRLSALQMSYLYKTYILQENEADYSLNDLYASDDPEVLLNTHLPADFVARCHAIKTLPLYALAEKLVALLGLERSADLYLQRFLDAVYEYSQEENLGLGKFLEYWDKKNLSVILPEGQDAVKIMTIHKSKGLEFPVVIMPFAIWEFSAGRDILWVHSGIEPFNSFRFMPVESVSGLANSIFADIYQEEENAIAIDNLNLLYVAFTRARERLYICCKLDHGGGNGFNNIAQLITACLAPDQDESTHLQFGTETIKQIKAGQEQSSIQADEEVTFPVREQLFEAESYGLAGITKILKHGAPLEFLQDHSGGLFGDSSPLALSIQNLFRQHNLLQFYSAETENIAVPEMLIPSFGAFRPHKSYDDGQIQWLLYILEPEEAEEKVKENLKTYVQCLAANKKKPVQALLLNIAANSALKIK